MAGTASLPFAGASILAVACLATAAVAPAPTAFALALPTVRLCRPRCEHHRADANDCAALFASSGDTSREKFAGDEWRESDTNLETDQRYLRFSGVGRLYSSVDDSLSSEESDRSSAHLSIVDRLTASTCAVIGIGGVGSWAAEALCRSGVGNIILIDLDDICISNVNRQLHATTTTVGSSKVDTMRMRLQDINPACNITEIFDFVTLDNIDQIMDKIPHDAVVLDCIDGQREKAALIVACHARQISVVTCGGAAGRTDPTQVVCADITRVNDDRLIFSTRKLLRKQYGWPKGPAQGEKNNHKVKAWNIPAVFSTELQRTAPAPIAGASSLRQCDGPLGTACFLTGTYGFVAAGKVVDMIATDIRQAPKKPKIYQKEQK